MSDAFQTHGVERDCSVLHYYVAKFELILLLVIEGKIAKMCSHFTSFHSLMVNTTLPFFLGNIFTLFYSWFVVNFEVATPFCCYYQLLIDGKYNFQVIKSAYLIFKNAHV